MIRRYSEFTDGYQSSIFCGMGRNWEADTSASFARRLGKSAAELGDTGGRDGCPDIWELSNGDIAVVGRDVTAAYEAGCLPTLRWRAMSAWS
jgi:hypothetical protein